LAAGAAAPELGSDTVADGGCAGSKVPEGCPIPEECGPRDGPVSGISTEVISIEVVSIEGGPVGCIDVIGPTVEGGPVIDIVDPVIEDDPVIDIVAELEPIVDAGVEATGGRTAADLRLAETTATVGALGGNQSGGMSLPGAEGRSMQPPPNSPIAEKLSLSTGSWSAGRERPDTTTGLEVQGVLSRMSRMSGGLPGRGITAG